MNEAPRLESPSRTPNQAHPVRRASLARCGAWAALVVAVGGCADASLQDVRLGRIAQPMERVFVVVHKGPLDRDYAVEMSSALVAALAGHTSAQAGKVLTGMELDDTALPAAVEQFASDGLLVLEPSGGTLSIYGGAPKVFYAATLLDVHTDHVVWRATVLHEGGTAVVGKRCRLAAEKMVQSLVLAHVVRGAGP